MGRFIELQQTITLVLKVGVWDPPLTNVAKEESKELLLSLENATARACVLRAGPPGNLLS